MQISIDVPYDEHRLRRTIAFIIKPQVRVIRILGVILTVLGLPLALLEPSFLPAWVFAVAGVVVFFGFGPMTVARSMRMQTRAIQENSRITIDDDGILVAVPLIEGRYRWPAFSAVVETPEVWYLSIGKLQAVTVPKAMMSPEQRAEFAAFLAGLRPGAVHP